MEHATLLKQSEQIDELNINATGKVTLRLFVVVMDAQRQFELEHLRPMTYEDMLAYVLAIPNPTTYGTGMADLKRRS